MRCFRMWLAEKLKLIFLLGITKGLYRIRQSVGIKSVKYISVTGALLVCTAVSCSFFGNNFYEVVEQRVYRSAQPSRAELERYIHEYKIKTIINLRGENEGKDWYDTEKEVARVNNLKLYNFRLESRTLPPVLLLDPIIDVLQRAERPLLIHCQSGIDRTGLVSALALAIELDPPILSLKNQLSWNNSIRPSLFSAGNLFFSAYEEWLRKTGNEHNLKKLMFFIKNEYIDGSGNITYYVDTAQDIIFKAKNRKSNRTATVSLNSDRVIIKGWAFDSRSKLPVYNLDVVIDDNVSERVKYKFFRPDVVKAFDLNKEILKNKRLGWTVEFRKEDLSLGCHKISLRVVNDRSEYINISTNVELCIK